ncbi:MAG: hypothetical protein Q9186_003422 [Xanthomendoza sp. 1 TL-2023]
MSPYPSAGTIEGIFHYRTLPSQADKFEQYVSDCARIHIFGQDFKLGGHSKGKLAFREFNKRMHSLADVEGDDVIEIVNVIGGGEQASAAVNTRCITKGNEELLTDILLLFSRLSTAGKGFYSEAVYLVKFNLEGMIIDVKIFMDTKHAHTHIGE